MRYIRTLTVAVAALGLSSGAALAWGDAWQGDATNDPNSGAVIFPYKAANNCPAGLQPVSVGGVICCGTPNAGRYYVDRAGGHRKKVHHKRAHAPRSYAPEGTKGVVYYD